MSVKVDNILLLTPAMYIYPKYDYLRLSPPLAIAYLSSSIKNNTNCEVNFLDIPAEGYDNHKNISDEIIRVGLSEDKIIYKLREIKPNMVGVSNIHTRDFKGVQELCEIVKTFDQNIITVIGGTHPTGNYRNVIKDINVDYIVIGEGEQVFADLVNFLNDKKDISCVYNIVRKERSNESKVVIKKSEYNNFFTIMPDWNLFNPRLYKEHFHTGGLYGNQAIDFFSSRGCPRGCFYCCADFMWGKKFRCLCKDIIIQQLTKLKELGYDEIILHDDNILVNTSRAKDLFSVFADLGFNWTIMGGLERSLIDDDIITSIIDNHCDRVHLSVESANTNILRHYNKFRNVSDETLSKTHHFVKHLADCGIEVFCDFMIGFPDETISDINKTINYAKSLRDYGMTYAEFSCVTPFPGTFLYDICLNQGYLSEPEKYEDFTLAKGNISTSNFSSTDITNLRLEALLKCNGAKIFKETRKQLKRPHKKRRSFINTKKNL